MLWIAVLIAIMISLAAVAYVAWPLLTPTPPPVIVENDELTDLIARKDALLAAIKELEFDYRVGKLAEEDYQRFNQRLRRQAIVYIQQIEAVTPESRLLDETLETEIARMRKTQDRPHGEVALPADQQLSDGSVEERAAIYCTNCGQPVAAHHKFCAHCGAPVGRHEGVPES